MWARAPRPCHHRRCARAFAGCSTLPNVTDPPVQNPGIQSSNPQSPNIPTPGIQGLGAQADSLAFAPKTPDPSPSFEVPGATGYFMDETSPLNATPSFPAVNDAFSFPACRGAQAVPGIPAFGSSVPRRTLDRSQSAGDPCFAYGRAVIRAKCPEFFRHGCSRILRLLFSGNRIQRRWLPCPHSLRFQNVFLARRPRREVGARRSRLAVDLRPPIFKDFQRRHQCLQPCFRQLTFPGGKTAGHCRAAVSPGIVAHPARTLSPSLGVPGSPFRRTFHPARFSDFAGTRKRTASGLARQRSHHSEAQCRDRSRLDLFTGTRTPTSTAPPTPLRRGPPMPTRAHARKSAAF